MAGKFEHAGPHPRSREAERRAQASAGIRLHDMQPGEVRSFTVSRGSAPPAEVKVGYHAEQSYGDDARPVRGAQIGYYHVHHGGHTRFFEHGPHATTDAAAKRGANPNAKSWAAEQARSHILGLA